MASRRRKQDPPAEEAGEGNFMQQQAAEDRSDAKTKATGKRLQEALKRAKQCAELVSAAVKANDNGEEQCYALAGYAADVANDVRDSLRAACRGKAVAQPEPIP